MVGKLLIFKVCSTLKLHSGLTGNYHAIFNAPNQSDHRISFFSLVRIHCKLLFVSESGSVKADL